MNETKEKINHPNLRQLVAFAVFMQQNEGILGKHPSYVFEKFMQCRATGVPEGLMDRGNMAVMAKYAQNWELDWLPSRDYMDVPIGAFNDKGEPIEFIERGKK